MPPEWCAIRAATFAPGQRIQASTKESGETTLRVFLAAKMVTAQLKEHQRKQKTSIGAVMTVTAADGVLQHRQVLQIAKAKAGESKLRSVTPRTHHSSTTIRARVREIQRAPTEGLLLPSPIRCTLATSAIDEE